MVPSPYQIEFDSYSDSFDTYDDLPASVAWIHTIGAALGSKFGVTISPNHEQWQIDHTKKEMLVGPFDDIYTRRGVLGLLLNGVGRLGFSIRWPATKSDATKFALSHGVAPKLAKHFGALADTIDEIRTDDVIAHEYAGGERVVDTMHAQAYEAAGKALQMMALDMRIRRQMARKVLDWYQSLMSSLEEVAKEPITSNPASKMFPKIESLFSEFTSADMSVPHTTTMSNINAQIAQNTACAQITGRSIAVVLMALYPEYADVIIKTMVRPYMRNLELMGKFTAYSTVKREEEEAIIQMADRIKEEVDEVKLFAAHTGGHAQYVIAKAEQYYHALSLGIQFVSPYAGYDMEAKALEVEQANDTAREIANRLWNAGITKGIDESIKLTKKLLPLLEPYPFLNLNDQKSGGEAQGNAMGKRVAGASQGQRPQKRKKEREKKSQGERSKDRKKMESVDDKRKQEIDDERNGYSILSQSDINGLERYAYIVGPYMNRIASAAARMRRILKVNDPAGMRGAYRRGKALNARILYRHRLDDYRLFARKEQEKDQSYGFVVTGDLSGSTESTYSRNNNRTIQDEVLAAAFLMAEISERIGEKVMCSIGFFSNAAATIKRAGFYLNRSAILSKITDYNGGTNVEAAGISIVDDLQEMSDFKIKQKTIVFITDGSFDPGEFLETVKAAKKFKASIAYFQIGSSVDMCKRIEKFVAQNAKDVRVRTRNLTVQGIAGLPEAMAQLMKETIGVTDR